MFQQRGHKLYVYKFVHKYNRYIYFIFTVVTLAFLIAVSYTEIISRGHYCARLACKPRLGLRPINMWYALCSEQQLEFTYIDARTKIQQKVNIHHLYCQHPKILLKMILKQFRTVSQNFQFSNVQLYNKLFIHLYYVIHFREQRCMGIKCNPHWISKQNLV